MSKIKYKEYYYNNSYFHEAILSGRGNIFIPEKTHSEFYFPHMNELWDDKHFSDNNNPINIGTIKNKEKFSLNSNIRVLDMPIKFPNNEEYRIPEEISQFESLIKQIAEFEHSFNPNINDLYCYITIDQRVVESDQFTRKKGLHVDGFQGARIPSPLIIDHSYIVSDVLPTIFYNQTFNVGENWDKNCYNYFLGFEEQINENVKFSFNPYEIALINAYCLHRADVAKIDTQRTFFRMSYTVREFDRLGNAINKMFDYEWDMVARNVEDTLKCKI